MDIKLKFINHSQDVANSSIVVFQKNVAENYDEIAVAWRVIKNLGFGDYHPLVYPLNFEVGAADSNGNYMPEQPATEGDVFEVVLENSGHKLRKGSSTHSSPTEVQVQNNLARGSISANIFRDGKLLALKKIVSPKEEAAFKFLPKIWVGVASQIVEGDVMDSAVISRCNTELDLFGITSADIVLTGGGKGPEVTPFIFSLQNVV